jgi:NADH-quinone oxidoreductase subunit C
LSSAETTDAPAEETERDDAREAIAERFRAELGDAVVGTHVRPGHAVWVRVDRSAWRDAALLARDGLACRFFDFLSAIDWLPSPFGRDMDSQEDRLVAGEVDAGADAPAEIVTGYAGGDTRFQLLARVYAPTTGAAVILKADLPDDDLSVASWVPVYEGANWHERETWEMFGIDFVGHPGLSHIYLPGDFEGHPLRKDFPLLARRVKPWPGIVDVEPMPGGADDGEGGEE